MYYRKTQKIKMLCFLLIGFLLYGFLADGKSPDIPKSDSKTETSAIVQNVASNIIDIFDNLGAGTNENSSDNIPSAHSSINIPAYDGVFFSIVNSGKPNFSKSEITTEIFEDYSPLDTLGRSGAMTACIGLDSFNRNGREDISYIYPSGWNNSKTYSFIEGERLMNRGHLLADFMGGDPAPENIAAMTREANSKGMLPFEILVGDYIEANPYNHVMYRVTPVFSGNNLFADGIQMEAYSVEDKGRGVSYSVFIHNVQPGVSIDYATGKNKALTNAEEIVAEYENSASYIINAGSGKFHFPNCDGAFNMDEGNRVIYSGKRSALISCGFKPCKMCNS